MKLLSCLSTRGALWGALLLTLLPHPSPAQVIVDFDLSAEGVEKRIPNWGLDTQWANYDNMRRGLDYMGIENVNCIRFPVPVGEANSTGFTTTQKAHLDDCIRFATMATFATKWSLCPDSENVGSWFQAGTGLVNTERWMNSFRMTKQYLNHPIWMVEPFNEPDYAPWGEGSKDNLYEMMGTLPTFPEFSDSLMAGGSTMSTDQAKPWFDAMQGRAKIGTQHALYGTATNYINFINHVAEVGAIPVNPEGHNVVEAILGAEYGLDTLIWWASAERTRGGFLKASKGRRLGYGEDRTNFTAAAVYRSLEGRVQAFLGSAERVGGATTYTFRSKDRDVYFDGRGPLREYSVTVRRNQERIINITWDADAPPVISGRYAIVNVKSGLCLEAAGASTTQGSQIQQAAFTKASHQLWDVYPMLPSIGGDISHFVFTNVNSGLNADAEGWVYDDNGPIKQYLYPANQTQHWYFEYAGNGCFRIRCRWSNNFLGIKDGALVSGAAAVQHSYTSGEELLWRFEDPNKSPVASPLAIDSQPSSHTSNSGDSVVFSTSAHGTGALRYQWFRDGNAIDGANQSILLGKAGTDLPAGTYTVKISDSLNHVVSQAATLTLKAATKTLRLGNLSVRSTAGQGADTLIVGFVVGGTSSNKQVVIRGIGPSLVQFGIQNAVLDPELTLFTGQSMLSQSQAWTGEQTLVDLFSSVGAFPLEKSAQDSAVAPTLSPGSYTVHLTSLSNQTKIGLVELYDADSADAGSSRLVNLSARTSVSSGEGVLIAGFAVSGDTEKTLLIRAIGPSLQAFGINTYLKEPVLEVIQGSTVLASNQGWKGVPAVKQAASSVGAFPLVSDATADSALLISLPQGTYSAKISSADSSQGVALVEVYEVP